MLEPLAIRAAPSNPCGGICPCRRPPALGALDAAPLVPPPPCAPTLCCRDDVLPCRVYLRHCVLAAQRLGAEAHASFLDGTFLSDRATTVRQHLEANPGILDELPPPSLVGRYSG